VQLWLFEHPPVAWCEVWQWVEENAGIPREQWRAAYYAQHWNVIAKIQRAKGYTGTARTRWPAARTPLDRGAIVSPPVLHEKVNSPTGRHEK